MLLNGLIMIVNKITTAAADNKWDKEQIEIRNHTLAVLAYDHIWK